MNAFTHTPTAPVSAPRTNVVPMPQRHVHRERDFGVGYGNSSGYATDRRYAQDWMQPRFRCA
ncbi:MAG TPA: hypothetical protein VIT90_17945 [Lysobacter sp.]